MTRRDYVKVANMLAGELAMAKTSADSAVRWAKIRQVVRITYSMADIFAQDNSNFDRQRFYDAVGL